MDQNIYLKILKLLGNKGTRFTTEDLAKELGTSKRTIYSQFASKGEMIEKTIDYVFSDITKLDNEILENDKLSLQEKVKLCFEDIPDGYSISAIIRHRDDLSRYYPELWEKVNDKLNTIWDKAIELVEQGIVKNEMDEINTVILRLILNESLKKLLDYEFLSQNLVSFESGMKDLSNIILYGIMKQKEESV